MAWQKQDSPIPITYCIQPKPFTCFFTISQIIQTIPLYGGFGNGALGKSTFTNENPPVIQVDKAGPLNISLYIEDNETSVQIPQSPE